MAIQNMCASTGKRNITNKVKTRLHGTACSTCRGRYLVAAQDLAEGDVVLVSEAYLSMILNSHKKRVCSLCHQDCRQRLSICCGARA
jgi:hypothetical protein